MKEYERHVVFRGSLSGDFYYASKVSVDSTGLKTVVGKKQNVSSSVQAYINEAIHQGWCDCLRNVLASIEGYPNAGGDIEIMAAIDRLVRKR